ncbi:MAG: membrane integrity-associated transporter subunit PqiC [Proteobacteria bacterium]|nr:membrane integrity-associated transporter subunit PqiC [Pseudomonadota bacterium]
MRRWRGSRARPAARFGAPALAFALALALSGCGGGGGLFSKAAPPAFDLTAAHDFPHLTRAPRGQLVIAEPTALAGYESEKIVVRPNAVEAAQMGDAQWQDRLPKLLQARLLQSFEAAGRLRAVGRPADKLATDFVLVTEVRAFEISAADRTAVIELAVKIVRERTGRIMAARVFRVTAPTEAADGAAAVAALNDAFVKVAREIVLWASKIV